LPVLILPSAACRRGKRIVLPANQAGELGERVTARGRLLIALGRAAIGSMRMIRHAIVATGPRLSLYGHICSRDQIRRYR
jgi:hypothetical protein